MRFKIPKQQPSSFKNSARYLAGLSHGKSPDRVAWMVANNLEVTHPDSAAAVMEATALQSKRCKQPVYHFILTFDPKDADAGKTSDELMQTIAKQTLERMGLQEYQSLTYAHKDTDHPHIHFLINRVHPETGKAYDRHRDGTRLKDIVRDLATAHGLNILKSKDQTRDRDLMDDQAGHLSDGQYRQAMKEMDGQEAPFSKQKIKDLRQLLRPAFYETQSWSELEQQLIEQGLHLRSKGQGLILTNGKQFAKLSEMGKGIRLSALEERFGQKFEAHRQQQIQEKTSSKTPSDDKTHSARYADYAVKELDAADQDYRYWSMIEQEYLSRKSSITKSERQHKLAENNRDRQFSWTHKRNVSLLDSLAKLYTNADRARYQWDAIEKKNGLETTIEMIKSDPALLGDLLPAPNPKLTNKQAQKDFRKLATLRRKYHTAKNRLDDAYARITTERRKLDKAKYDYEMLCNSVGSLEQIKTSVREKIRIRAMALSRITAKMLKDANLTEERREQLHKTWLRHLERKRKRERDRSRY
ncbi:MAG: relaxase/mobilization nuclease domain-containing protein [Cohaesibacter sp.]|nr:relaxase/mobilization nuclease domain-containing protein [Cohaesibacter sp.]